MLKINEINILKRYIKYIKYITLIKYLNKKIVILVTRYIIIYINHLTIISSLDDTNPIIHPRLGEYRNRGLSFVLSVTANWSIIINCFLTRTTFLEDNSG